MGGGSASKKSDCVGGATQLGCDGSDAGTYFSLFFHSVQALWSVEEVEPHSARHAVVFVKKTIVSLYSGK